MTNRARRRLEANVLHEAAAHRHGSREQVALAQERIIDSAPVIRGGDDTHVRLRRAEWLQRGNRAGWAHDEEGTTEDQHEGSLDQPHLSPHFACDMNKWIGITRDSRSGSGGRE
jgi:hypothetical protein